MTQLIKKTITVSYECLITHDDNATSGQVSTLIDAASTRISAAIGNFVRLKGSNWEIKRMEINGEDISAKVW